MFYQLEVPGRTLTLYFAECLNVGIAHEVIEFKDGDDVRKRPGKRYSNQITLKRLFDANISLWEWYKQNMDYPVYYNASLYAYDASAYEIARWNLTKIWPNRLVTATDESGVSYDVLTITYEDIQRVN